MENCSQETVRRVMPISNIHHLRSCEYTADVSCSQFWTQFSATLTSGQLKIMCDDDRATSLAPQVAFDTCWPQTENTWSRLQVKLSDVLPTINQINCTYIDLMGLEWGHGVGDINLGWKSAIGWVRSHLTGFPWPAGRGGWFLWWFIFMYLSILLQPQLPWMWGASQPS